MTRLATMGPRHHVGSRRTTLCTARAQALHSVTTWPIRMNAAISIQRPIPNSVTMTLVTSPSLLVSRRMMLAARFQLSTSKPMPAAAWYPCTSSPTRSPRCPSATAATPRAGTRDRPRVTGGPHPDALAAREPDITRHHQLARWPEGDGRRVSRVEVQFLDAVSQRAGCGRERRLVRFGTRVVLVESRGQRAVWIDMMNG